MDLRSAFSAVDEHPEYSKPLGEPLGAAKVVAGKPPHAIWTRSFKSGTRVFLNTTDHPKVDTSCIWWADGTTTGNHCAKSPEEARMPTAWFELA